MVTDYRVKKIIFQIVEDIKSKYDPEEIILYGSFAYGIPNENSDIDVLIIKETSERPLDRMSLVHRIVDIRDSSYPAFSPRVLTNTRGNHAKTGDWRPVYPGDSYQGRSPICPIISWMC